jgi:hypothetical protein
VSPEMNKTIVLRYFLVSHNAPYNLDVIDEVCKPAYAAQQREWHAMERTAFPDNNFDVEDVIAEGDKVVLRWHFRGTHLGDSGPRSAPSQSPGNNSISVQPSPTGSRTA